MEFKIKDICIINKNSIKKINILILLNIYIQKI